MKEWAWFLWMTQDDRHDTKDRPQTRVGVYLPGVFVALAAALASGVLIFAG